MRNNVAKAQQTQALNKQTWIPTAFGDQWKGNGSNLSFFITTIDRLHNPFTQATSGETWKAC